LCFFCCAGVHCDCESVTGAHPWRCLIHNIANENTHQQPEQIVSSGVLCPYCPTLTVDSLSCVVLQRAHRD
jgi:hypothetical protein